MYCKRCGNQLDDSAKFCDRCGMKIETAGKKKKIMTFTVCVAGIIVIAAITAVSAMKMREPVRKETAAQRKEPEKDIAEKTESQAIPESKQPQETGENQEPEEPVKDYVVNYREAYKSILSQAENSQTGVSAYGVHDMDGDGVPELFVLEGDCVAANRWVAYSYDIETGSPISLGEIVTGSSEIFEPENREAGIIALWAYMGEEEVFSVKKVGKDRLDIRTAIERHKEPGDYFSTPYPLGKEDLSYLPELELVQGETVTRKTGLSTPEGKEVFRIPGEVFATSVLQEPGIKYSTENLSDLDPSTVWAEGAEGNGTGEALVIDSHLPYQAEGIAILPGYCKDQELYQANGRPVRVTVKCADKMISKELKDFTPDFENPLNSMIYIEFEEPVYTEKFTVSVTQAVNGGKYENMCIAELFPYSYTPGY